MRELVNKSHEEISELVKRLELIGEGQEVKVYALDDEKVIKVLKSKDAQNSGERLKMMQGAPFIPKLYEYHDSYYIQQRINGVELDKKEKLISTKEFDKERFEENIQLLIEHCHSVDWFPTDWIYRNMMFDRNADFWIVDLGHGGNAEGVAELKQSLQSRSAEIKELLRTKEKEEIEADIIKMRNWLSQKNWFSAEEIEDLLQQRRGSHALAENIKQPLFNAMLAMQGVDYKEMEKALDPLFIDTEVNLKEIGKYIERNYTKKDGIGGVTK